MPARSREKARARLGPTFSTSSDTRSPSLEFTPEEDPLIHPRWRISWRPLSLSFQRVIHKSQPALQANSRIFQPPGRTLHAGRAVVRVQRPAPAMRRDIMKDSRRRVRFTDPIAMVPAPDWLRTRQRIRGCVMETRRRLLGCALVIWTALALAPMAGTALAATPPSGTVSESIPTVTWTGNVMPPTAGGCGGPNNPACDNFKLN